MRCVVFVAWLASQTLNVWAQGSLQQTARNLAQQHADKVTYLELGKTASGQPLYVLTLGKGNAADKPALCIVAGTRKDYAYTSELALLMCKQLLEDETWLARYTLYVVPEASPDELYMPAPNHYSRNATPYDDDKDARTDEDPADDLNGDGRVAWMRYPDPAGNWAPHPTDPRVMVPWQKLLEAGLPVPIRYQLLPEGKDDDGDGKYNEDGRGGTAFEQNWPWNYRWFAPGSGVDPVSEPETRALADFLFDHKNIYAVMVLGPHSNLTEAWKETLSDAKLPQSKLGTTDQKTYQLLAQQYAKQVRVPHMATEEQPGFLHWAHFHYGRWALGSPGWRPAYDPKDDKLTDGLRTPEYKYLMWRKAQKTGDLLYDEWVSHKGGKLPASEVEIGGARSWALWTPPADTLQEMATRHMGYLQWVLSLYPSLDVKPELKQLDKDLWQLTLKVTNSGALPTHTELGGQHPYTQAVVCDVQTGNTLVAGLKRTKLPVLVPGAQYTLKYIIRGNADFTYRVHSPQTGAQVLTLPLK